jgi:hypothetical protein
MTQKSAVFIFILFSLPFAVLLKGLSRILAVLGSSTGLNIDCDCRLVLVVMDHLKLDHDSLLPHPYQFTIHHLFCHWALHVQSTY